MCLLQVSAEEKIDSNFKSIFNGKDLSGWKILEGQHDYKVEEDGVLVGTAKAKTPNGFLTFEKSFQDFELRFEVKCDPRLNSGVQVRSHFGGKTFGGPQIEIEERTAGYIYEESGRGWLSKHRVKNNVLKPGKWNQYRVVAEGARIRTWVNGVPIADVVDNQIDKRGVIGLQVHGIPASKAGAQVRWRNIQLKELASPQFETLYNGKDLKGFVTTGNWQPKENGVLELTPRKGERGWTRWGSYLWTEKEYGDFECSFDYLHGKGGNSGLYFRVTDRSYGTKYGMEVQILDSYGKKGPLNSHDCGGLISAKCGATSNMSKAPGVWNHMQVRCVGIYLTVHLNGQKIQEVQLDKTPLKSYVDTWVFKTMVKSSQLET